MIASEHFSLSKAGYWLNLKSEYQESIRQQPQSLQNKISPELKRNNQT